MCTYKTKPKVVLKRWVLPRISSFYSRDATLALYCHVVAVLLSFCPSVTGRCSIETERIGLVLDMGGFLLQQVVRHNTCSA